MGWTHLFFKRDSDPANKEWQRHHGAAGGPPVDLGDQPDHAYPQWHEPHHNSAVNPSARGVNPSASAFTPVGTVSVVQSAPEQTAPARQDPTPNHRGRGKPRGRGFGGGRGDRGWRGSARNQPNRSESSNWRNSSVKQAQQNRRPASASGPAQKSKYER